MTKHAVLRWMLSRQVSILHTVSQKQDTKLLPITSPVLTDFHNSFTDRLSNKFATKRYLNILPHLRYVATVTCEIWMPKSWQLSKICINGKPQGGISGGTLLQKFITQFGNKKFKSANIWRSCRQKGWLCHMSFIWHFCPQRCRIR